MKITRQVFFLTLCGEILKVDIRLSEIHIQKATNLYLAIKKAEFAPHLLFLNHVEGSTLHQIGTHDIFHLHLGSHT